MNKWIAGLMNHLRKFYLNDKFSLAICLASLELLPPLLSLFIKEMIMTISPVISKEFSANTGKVLPFSTGKGLKYNHLTVFYGLPKD